MEDYVVLAVAIWPRYRRVSEAQIPHFVWVSLATVLHTVDHGDEFGKAMIRLGLCCMFRDQPIKFVTTTATTIGKMKRLDALAKLSRICMDFGDHPPIPTSETRPAPITTTTTRNDERQTASLLEKSEDKEFLTLGSQ